MKDIRRQNILIKNPINPPEISIIKKNNKIIISKIKIPKELEISRARIQVGIAVPERRITTGEELGTGVGESTPMTVAHRRLMMLEPMRVLDSGQWKYLENNIENEFELLGPEKLWPGSIYSGLIAVHWELILEFVTSEGTKMKWVRPLIMENYHHKIEIKELPVRSGRLELSDY
jgi:hypothetical protein